MIRRSILGYTRTMAIFGVALLGALVPTKSLGFSNEFRQSYPLTANGSFELLNINGTVEIEGWDRNEVEVRAVKTALHHAEDMERVTINVDSQPTRMAITTHYPAEEGVEVAVDYTIHVPLKAHLGRISTVNGTVRLGHLEDIAELRTVNGNIEVFEGTGHIKAHSINGNVFLQLKDTRDVGGTLAETTNGSVLLAVPRNTQATLEALSMNGSFQSELPLILLGSAQPREVHGKLGQGGTPIRLRTVNGAIRVVASHSTV